jgi:hypothetical protein
MSEYLIPTPVTVVPIQNVNFMSEILFDDATSNLNRKLYEGDLIDSSQVIAYLSGKLNSECYFDRNTLSYSGIYKVNFVILWLFLILLIVTIAGNGAPDFVTTFGSDRNVSFSLSFDNISTIVPQYIGFNIVRTSNYLIVIFIYFIYVIT